jgi:hypothetical protein
MRVVTLDAGVPHDTRLGVAHDELPINLGEFMDRILPVARAQLL